MKDKGDREERAVRDILRANGFPGCERTRAGYTRDAGDLHASPGVIVQVKDVKTPDWTKWTTQLADQKCVADADVAFISLKRPRPGKPPLRLAILPLDEMLPILRRAGYGTPITEGPQ